MFKGILIGVVLTFAGIVTASWLLMNHGAQSFEAAMDKAMDDASAKMNFDEDENSQGN